MIEAFPTYRDALPEISAQLAERGSLGLLLIDASSFAVVEHEYGGAAFDEVRRRAFNVLLDCRSKEFRTDDRLVLEEPRGLRFLVFLGPKRRRAVPATSADLKALHVRVIRSVLPNLAHWNASQRKLGFV